MNKTLFAQASPGALVPQADATNAAGGLAYKPSDEQALAQLAMTGTFGNAFYCSAEQQLTDLLVLAEKVSNEYLAQLAVYACLKGWMKDTPIVLLALLSTRSASLFEKAFDLIVTDGKMLRNFVQVIRSGIVGRKSLGTVPKRKINQWLNKASAYQLLNANIGNNPTLGDVIRMAHPKASDPARQALFRWIIGSTTEESKALLPDNVKAFMDFNAGLTNTDNQESAELTTEDKEVTTPPVPDVPFLMLTEFNLSGPQWQVIADRMTWSQLRQNLTTFEKKELFKVPEFAQKLAERLADPELVRKAKVFPFQIMSTYLNVGSKLPFGIKNALNDALEVSLENVPDFPELTTVACDVSGSMKDPVTGRRDHQQSYRKGNQTVTPPPPITNRQVAALMTCAVMRRCKSPLVWGFDDNLYDFGPELNPRDTVLTNAEKIAKYNGGATACWLPLKQLYEQNIKQDLVILTSDNESWVVDRDSTRSYNRWAKGTELQKYWNAYKSKFPNAKLVLIDISPEATAQAVSSKDVLNIAGFSDEVFTIIDLFINNKLGKEHWVGEIKKTAL